MQVTRLLGWTPTFSPTVCLARLRGPTRPRVATFGISSERTWKGFDAVVHLAGISNDPLGDFNSASTYDVDHLASVRLAEVAKTDINPCKQGMLLPGTGHEVVAPERRLEEPLNLVVVMNPEYDDEIGQDLQDMGMPADIVSV